MQTNGNHQGTMSTTEAAQALGVSKTTITRLVKRGLLIGWKLTPRRNSPLRITKASVDRYIALNRPT